MVLDTSASTVARCAAVMGNHDAVGAAAMVHERYSWILGQWYLGYFTVLEKIRFSRMYNNGTYNYYCCSGTGTVCPQSHSTK